jgi:hypothetical protein
MPWRLKKRRIEPSVVCNPSVCNTRCAISTKVRSGSLVLSSSSQAPCGSNGERLLPPRGLGLTLPVVSFRSVQRTADEALTL